MFPTPQVGNFRLSFFKPVWEISDVAESEELKGRALYDALRRIAPSELNDADWCRAAGVNRGFLTNVKTGSGAIRSDNLRKLLGVIGKTEADLYEQRPANIAKDAPSGAREPEREEPAMVQIEHIDLAYGLGATFTDSPVEIEVLDFPKQWVETITYSPPALLTWARGKGDSMRPTIDDGDLVLLDRSQRDVREQDALWAITVGDTGSIKRLRKKGDRFQIFSDNPAVPMDEEPIDFVNVVARVIFVGRRI